MAGFQLSDQQRFDWLRLIRTESIGPKTFRTLINRFGGAGAALANLPELARSAGRRLALPSLADIELEVEQSRRLGVRFVAMGEAGYPVPLAASQSAPPLIAVRGNLAALAKPMIALVGSRNASGLGLKFTEKLARELGEAGFVIVSGLARGIDTAAHMASVATGTVAVLAGGHGRIYPQQNEPLLEELLASGAAISELPFTVEPRPRDFPRRNRIVAALSMAVVVVEAARKSGSLITARLALDEGRELFAVPGSPMDPRAEGTNDLLARREVHICRSAQDIISELQPQIGQAPRATQLFDGAGEVTGQIDLGLEELDWLLTASPESHGQTPEHANRREASLISDDDQFSPLHADTTTVTPEDTVCDLIGTAAISSDDLTRQSRLPARLVQGVLVDLEMRGLIHRDPSGGYVRA
ncbi:MAG: DNA-processing protein DprA [Bosea sp. (in: a-proteobacteria)]